MMLPDEILLHFVNQAAGQSVVLTPKRLQRLVYLLQTEGATPLGYPFGISYYGPFSPALAKRLEYLASDFRLSWTRLPDGHIHIRPAESAPALAPLPPSVAHAMTLILSHYGSMTLPALIVYTTAHFLYHRSHLHEFGPLLAQTRAYQGALGSGLCQWAVTRVLFMAHNPLIPPPPSDKS
ncbi:hypothetical protein SAMN00768000_3680 [Sulfobacillus thermosulfidooxidans DSM 9293]|uniref:Uncharacterized protein n=1 Tax=Sulfobacillus thermosulfidooxidans (strain DSM 9293 / VKM B-1269 / AT-1) TaxID=929705 RepID=A0A1W1WQZ1_SULTA|nr:hypothetical protein [Sulfobacillus thermosulfidooxidans]SMC08143.1 hypothetical protein SAMN00768000_3680 [Sulfobacillus thermosulfidooxidans DSM 9293]